jgi:hypothetical protein
VDADFPAMIETLETRMSRRDIASAIGVEEQEVEEIASGYVPEEEVGDRLRELVASGERSRRIMRIPVWAVVMFVVVDSLIFAALAAFLALR